MSGQQVRILSICCFAVFMVGIDVTAVNVALPDMHRTLGAGITGLQWTIDAYTVVLAGSLILAGSLADRLGRRRVLLSGLATFTLASALCSLAPTAGVLIACRVLQAVGASMLTPVAMSIVTNTITEPRRRAHAIGYWNAVYGIAMALGPVVGGVAVAAFDWRAIFWINIPVGMAAVALTFRFVPESRAVDPRRLDPVGQVLVVSFLATLTFGIIEGPSRGWTSPAIVGVLAVAVVSLVALIRYETRHPHPLIDIGLFRSTRFSAGVAIAIAAFATFGGFLFLNTLYLQQSRGFTALQAGLATVPMAASTVLFSPLAGRLLGRFGPRPLVMVAGVCLTVAPALLIGLDPTTPLPLLFFSYVLLGIGFGTVNPPITEIAVSGMPRGRAGVAAAISTTSRQVGQTLGVAIIGAAAAAGADPLAGEDALAWQLLTLTGLAVILLGLRTNRHPSSTGG